MTTPITILIRANVQKDVDELVTLLPASEFKVISHLGTHPEGSDFPSHDLLIYCLSGEPTLQAGTDAAPVSPLASGALFITSSPLDAVRLYAFQRGAADFLVRPFTAVELHSRVERLLRRSPARLLQKTNEQSILDFLKHLSLKTLKVVEPAIEPLADTGFFYPEVASFFGRLGGDVDFLEKLAESHLLDRKLANRVHLCPLCNNLHINFREYCPKCRSLEIYPEEMIHHFACGHINSIKSFQKGSDLICPKCGKTLRHIGLDYEKPSKYYKCHDCDFIGSEPAVQAQCLWCAFVCDPSKLVEKTIYRYLWSAETDRVMLSGQVSGSNLASFLHNKQTGLYSRQYFEHELQREMIRYGRYKQDSTVLLVRVEDLERIQREYPGQASDYANTVFQALNKNLRPLDATCVWDKDLVAILLPNTPSDGGQIVARRMYENTRDLEFLFNIEKPKISLALKMISEYKTAEELLTAARKELDTP